MSTTAEFAQWVLTCVVLAGVMYLAFNIFFDDW